MDCKLCKHNNVCKYKEYCIECENILLGKWDYHNLEDSPININCDFYEEIQESKEPYEIYREYKIIINNGMEIYSIKSLEDLEKECKNQLRKGNHSFSCYENILYSNNEIKSKKIEI